MYYYYNFGLHIESDLQFPQFTEETHISNADISITEGPIPDDIMEKSNTLYYEFGDEISWLVNSTTWLVVSHGKNITYKTKPQFNASYLRTYITGYGISMLCMQRKLPAVHCSAIKSANGAILIAGESGAGKSTISARLLSKGLKLMADDLTILAYDQSNTAIAYPSFPYQKLCREAALAAGHDLSRLIYIDEHKDKFLVPYSDDISTEPVQIKAFVMLTVHHGDTPLQISEVSGINKLNMIYGNLFLRRLHVGKNISPLFVKTCLEIAGCLPMYIVSRPSVGNTVKEITDYIYNNLI